jgi:hypothetical protein
MLVRHAEESYRLQALSKSVQGPKEKGLKCRAMPGKQRDQSVNVWSLVGWHHSNPLCAP